MKPLDYYSCDPDEELLSEKSIDDAVAEHLDTCHVDEWPTMLPVYGWRRMAYTFDPERILADALEAADGEHADPDGDGTDPTPAMVAAAEAFAAVLTREYQVWSCERAKDPVETVNVAEWILAENPNWLEDVLIHEWVEKHRGGAA